jgi:predicted lipoprotein with Yx(FWY)xxD motif
VTRLRFLVAAALIGALSLFAAGEASASTAISRPGVARPAAAHHAVAAKKKKKKKHKKKSTTSTTVSAADATVRTGAIAAGTVLVSNDGRTLYMRDTDTTLTSSCTGPCATIWPALVATGKPSAGPGVDDSKLTVAMQAIGNNQIAYAGHLLYNFANDTAPGDAKGLGIPGWHAVSTDGTAVGGS